MIDKLAFLVVEGIKNFTRNKLANFICIVTILINFTILGTFFVFGYNTDNIVNFFRSKYTFEVFLKSDTSLDQAVSLKNVFLEDSLISSVNLIGKEVRTLQNNALNSGSYSVTWNGKDNYCKDVPSGMYLYNIESNGRILSGKMLLLK